MVSAIVLVAAGLIPAVAGTASGEETLSALQARMQEIQADLDARTVEIEGLRDDKERLDHRIEDINARIAKLNERRRELGIVIAARADELYRSGRTSMVELLFASKDISELTTRAEILSRVSDNDAQAFVEYARSTDELEALSEELSDSRAELTSTTENLANANAELQDEFERVAAEYEELKAKLTQTAPAPTAGIAPVVRATNGMACPVAGPVSFVDSWGAPRAGHTHVGVDMLADYGTPVVAIVSGTITYTGWDDSGGNMIFLSGEDGNDYWYMHNQANLVTGGRVERGEQIATVGDTGNAVGIPHVHFEYHPGGGGPVNPYPLVASIC